MQATLDGVGGLLVTYHGTGQLYPNAQNGFALRSGSTVSYPGSPDRTNVSASVDGTMATIAYDVSDLHLHLHVVETDELSDARHELKRTFDVTNAGTADIGLRAGELADTAVGGALDDGFGDDSGRGVAPSASPRIIAGLSRDGQISGLVEATPWSHYQEGFYEGVFNSFASRTLHDSVDPDYADNGVGAEWDFELAQDATKTIAVVWRFDGAVDVTSHADHDDGSCDSDCTLREALADSGDGAVISVPSGTYVLDPKLGPLIAAHRDVAIYGAGASTDGGTVVTGADLTRALEVAAGADLTVSGLRFENGSGTAGAHSEASDGTGGAILVAVGAPSAWSTARSRRAPRRSTAGGSPVPGR